MNNKHWAVIGALIFIIVFLGLALAYAFLRQPPAPSPAVSATPAAPAGGAGPQSLSERGQYYDVSASYPGSTPLLQSAGAAADAAAVSAMKSFVRQQIADFKSTNVANLTAEQITADGLDQGQTFSLQMSYKQYQGTGTVSYVYTIDADTLGAHPNEYFRTFVFDAGTGKLLALGDLFSSSGYLTRLSTLARADLPALIAAQAGSSADTQFMTQGTAPSAENFQSWYVDGSDLVLVFPPYQVGPYALGTVMDRIALTRLGSALKAPY